MTSPVIAYIDQNALLNNLHTAREKAPNAKVLAMVKANAYGHGFENVVKVLHNDVDAFAVARLDEGLQLRSLHVTKPIVIMAGFYTAEQLEIMTSSNLDPVVHTTLQVDILEKIILDSPIVAWLKIDTGMSRLGFMPEEVAEIYQRLSQCKNVSKIIMLTHFPDADDLEKPITQQQIKLFNETTKNFPVEKSLAKSAGVLAYPTSYAQWIRPGIMLYGGSPLKNKTATQLGLKPVMTLTAPVIAIRHLPKGTAVGYGGTYICPEDMPIGVIGVGYGDGYPRHAKLGTPVLLNGKTVPLAGRVCMDMIMVDLRECPDVKIGDEAVLWGKGLPAEEIAECSETSSYELFCNVSKRVKFEVI